MKKLKINNEFAPNRCEICHQSDVFDPINNRCSRCKKVEITQPKDVNSKNIKANRVGILTIISTILAWMVVCGVYAYVFVNHILSMPDIEQGYVSTWDFQLVIFFIFRFPFLLVILIMVVILEYYFLKKTKKFFKFVKKT